MLIEEMKEKATIEQDRGLNLLVDQKKTRKEIMNMIQKTTLISPRDQDSQNVRYFQFVLDHLIVTLLQVEMQEVGTLLRKVKLTSMNLKLVHTFSE